MVYVIVNNGRVCVTLQRSVLGGNELMFFADICAGPGGFTEYMLYRTRWHAKGYGFTLKGEQYFHVRMYRMYVHSQLHTDERNLGTLLFCHWTSLAKTWMIMRNVSTTVWLSSSVAVQTEGDSPYTVQATDKDNHVDVEPFGSIIIKVLADGVHSTCPHLPSHKGFFSCM